MTAIRDTQLVLKQLRKLRKVIEESEHACILDVVDVYLDQSENELLNLLTELSDDEEEYED